MTKTCIDCKWCDWPAFATGDLTVIEMTAACFHPRAKATVSMVTGSAQSRGRPCLVTRGGGGRISDWECGPEGNLWEGKPGAAGTVTP